MDFSADPAPRGPEPDLRSAGRSRPWWESTVVYQIYPRSFLDTTGNGIGDLEGVIGRLDYLRDLGVGAVWLSPFYPSPMADFGYDVADYCDVDPLFGSLADFDRLVIEAHRRDLRVLIDWVPNHTSDQHPWFIESRRSRQNPYRDWYYWRDPKPSSDDDPAPGPGSPPNNWVATFDWSQPAWTWDPGTAQWYLHCFLPEQPDLNWANPAVVGAMHDVLRFWLDRGVDGFRIDVVHLLGKDPALPDDPPHAVGLPHSNDDARTHVVLRDLRRILDSYPGDRVMVGEVYLLSTARVATYYGANDELHLSFNFPPLLAPWDCAAWRKRITRTVTEMDAVGGWPTWVLSNHDNPRHRTRYGGSEGPARAASALLLGLRGTPFLYAGEELGLQDATIPPERRVDPGGRDGCRAPVPWTADARHGWATGDPWLPWPPEPERYNAETEKQDPESFLHLYQRLLAARRRSPALSVGDFAWASTPPEVLGWFRSTPTDRRLVLVNFTAAPATVTLEPHRSWTVEVTTAGPARDGSPFDGQLAANEAVFLR